MKIISIPFSIENEKGIENSPNKILNELKGISMNENGIPLIYDTESVKTDNDTIEQTLISIRNSVKESIKNNNKTIILGGDNSITFHSFKALAESNENAGIVLFDSFPDCSNENPTRNWLRALVEKGILKKDNIAIVALRNWNKEEFAFIRSNRIKTYSCSEISKEGIHNMCDAVMSVAKNFSSLYISIDISCLDPSFAPASSKQEPAGLSSRDLVYFIQRLMLLRNFRVADITEIDSDKDKNSLTVKTAAKIVAEMA